jgi:Mn-dependent DtxR family transcriptional regulator
MKHSGGLTKSVEDYLEAIYMLELAGEKIKSVKIAAELEVSKPAVNRAMNGLAEEGFIEKSDYSDIALTDKGREVAKEIYDRHRLLMQFLMKLGVSEETAAVDCCKMEHILSGESLARIKEFVKGKQLPNDKI